MFGLTRMVTVGALLAALTGARLAPAASAFDAATAFGARESVSHLRLSPDGASVAYIAPSTGQGATLFTLSLAKGAAPRAVLYANGSPDRLVGCDWIADDRLVCTVYGIDDKAGYLLLPFTRLVAVDADGRNLRVLSTRETAFTRGLQLSGGSIVDSLPAEAGAVLMARLYLPDEHVGSRLGSAKEGLGIDWVDTRTLKVRTIEPPRPDVAQYLSDGRGTVRMLGVHQRSSATGQDAGVVSYSYRTPGSRDWQKFGDYDERTGTGFEPEAIDHDLNVAYGFKKKDGRRACYTIALDGSLREELMHARPDVDIDGLVRVGRRKRVVGVSYTDDMTHIVYTDPGLDKIVKSLSQALPTHPMVWIVDSSLDESKLLVFAGRDQDPGVYYLFDRKTHELHTFLVVRSELEGATLAEVKPISYPAADGTPIPGYLTLPPGRHTAQGLPAIVMPHGGPSSRDRWGFNWQSQFFAARGYAVLQPNFRGSTGYGDAWLNRNGFRSWRTSIGDVLDAGRWLVAQGIADPAKLAIVGWSYGGYAALQSAVMDPALYKAVVAIAPVTDLNALKEEHRYLTDFRLISDFIGEGPEARAGSPALNADKIKVPVLLFHGGLDRNVAIGQSKEMAARLRAAGVPHELVTWDGLDHQLEDSAARAEMLRKSDEFLRKAMGF